MQKLFPLGDWLNSEERARFGISEPVFYLAPVRAVYAKEKRCPKKGEWYLSGATVTAYRAPNDLKTVYHIAKLVRVKEIKQTIIVPDKSS